MATLKSLYELTKSLSKSEKRTLHIYIENQPIKGKENYIKQLNNFYSIPKYDETVLKDKMKNITTKRLSEFNTNLFNLITKVLGLHLADSTVSIEILQQIVQIEVLLKKGIYSESEKLIDQLLKKYSNYGYSELIAYLYKLKHKFGLRTFLPFDELINLQDEKIKANSASSNEGEYMKLNFQMNQYLTKDYFPRSAAQLVKYKKLLKDPLLKDINCAHSNYAKHYYYMIKVPLLNITGQIEESLATSKAAIQFVKENFNRKIDPFPETFQLRRYLNLLITLKISDGLIDVAQEINSLINYLPTKQSKDTIWSNTLDAHLHTFLINKEYQRGVDYFEKEAKDFFDNNVSRVNRLDAKALLIARLYFLINNYEAALHYCEIALKGEQYKFISFVLAAKFLTLMIYYKTDNALLLPYATRSLQRSLQQQNQLYPPEKALLSYLGKVKNINGMKKGLQKLKIILEKEKSNPLNDPFFNNGDYLIWIQHESN